MILLILILLFMSLIIYQISNHTISEGFDIPDPSSLPTSVPSTSSLPSSAPSTTTSSYQTYSQDPVILAQQNAGNIQVLKDRMDTLAGLGTTVAQLKDQVKGLTDAMTASAMKDTPVAN